jgi:hypothetical protein
MAAGHTCDHEDAEGHTWPVVPQPTVEPAHEPTTLGMELVQVMAEAISHEEMRQLSGFDPRGGHGYYSTAITAAIAALDWLAERNGVKGWDGRVLELLADLIGDDADRNAWRPTGVPRD